MSFRAKRGICFFRSSLCPLCLCRLCVKSFNHSAFVRLLEKHRLASARHHFLSESQGQETQATYYFRHHKNRPYYIYYISLHQQWASQIKTVELGTHAAWHKLSDHVPLAVDVAMPRDSIVVRTPAS